MWGVCPATRVLHSMRRVLDALLARFVPCIRNLQIQKRLTGHHAHRVRRRLVVPT
jgi:hypothetical protein